MSEPVNWKPNSKVTDGGFAGALAAIGLGTLQVFRPEIVFPPGYEAAVAVVLMVGISYLMPERRAI